MIDTLAKKLKSMYDSTNTEKAAMVHLFGIIYADEMARYGISAAEMIRAAGLTKGYNSELSKGIKLSEYVQLKDEYKNKF